MSYFYVCHTLSLLFLCFIVLLGSPAKAAGEDDPLFTLSSREELVQMAGYGEERLSTVLVTGSVHCEASLNGEPHAWPIPGASIDVNCHSNARERKDRSMVAQGVTDEFGDFIIYLPSYLHSIPNLEKVCIAKVRHIPKDSVCQPASVKRHKELKLSSFGNGIRTYSAGKLRFQLSTSKPLHW